LDNPFCCVYGFMRLQTHLTLGQLLKTHESKHRCLFLRLLSYYRSRFHFAIMPVHYFFRCRKCSKPIELPTAKSLDTQPNQEALTTGGRKKVFLCLECTHLHEYSQKDIQSEIQDTQSPWELGEYRCWSVRYKCADENCGTPIETFAVSDVSVVSQTILEKFLSAIWPSASRVSVCPKCGHEVYPPEHPKQYDVVPCLFPY
jgi:DNA-directed RNA polymerase subunit RPC12/RpoP